MSSQPISDQTAKGNELALEAYKLLVALLQQEEGLFWKRIEILLIFNAGLIGILGLIKPFQDVSQTEASRVLPLLICSVGVVISILWVIIVRRSEAFYNHWYEQLKYLEKEYLSPIKTFQIADEYFAKGKVKLGGEEFKLDALARRLHIYHALIGAPLVFLVAWLGLGVFLIVRIP